MPKMRINWRSVAAQAFSNSLLGMTPGVLEALFGNLTIRQFLVDAGYGMVYANCIGFSCWAAIPHVARRVDRRSPAVRFAAIGGSLLVVGALGFALASLLLLGTGLISGEGFVRSLATSLRVCLVITLLFGSIVTVITTLQERLDVANQSARDQRLAAERAAKIAAEARLASLESRVRPHFLFNTLNSIAALVRENPAVAEKTVERLAALLRFSLDSEYHGLAPLAEELRMVREYLEIEKVRFGERLRYRIEVDHETEPYHVPALSVQTLVENSVKYAAGQRREATEIVVSARMDGGRLRVEVSDNGPGFDLVDSLKPGHGLDLLQRRLRELFGPAAMLNASAVDGRMSVSMLTP